MEGEVESHFRKRNTLWVDKEIRTCYHIVILHQTFIMTIALMSLEETRQFESQFLTEHSKKRKYDWDNMKVGQGFAIAKTEMPSVNYNGPTLPDYLYRQGWRISCRKTKNPDYPLFVKRTA